MHVHTVLECAEPQQYRVETVFSFIKHALIKTFNDELLVRLCSLHKMRYRSSSLHLHPCPHLALEYSRPRRSVRLLSVIQVVCNTWVGSLVRSRKTDGSRCLARTAGDDIDLGTLHVELRSRVAASRVEGDQLTAEQVLAWRDASGDRNGLLALVGDKAIDTPFGAVK